MVGVEGLICSFCFFRGDKYEVRCCFNGIIILVRFVPPDGKKPRERFVPRPKPKVREGAFVGVVFL